MQPHLAQAAEQQSLYERLGGYDTISEIIDEFLKKMFTDPQVGKYFIGMGTDTREQLRQKNKLLMCKNTGGPCKIINREMKLAHAGLGVTDSDWQVTLSHLAGTLESLKVGEQEQRELLQLISSLKKYIVEGPGQ
jgi:hemoglobin